MHSSQECQQSPSAFSQPSHAPAPAQAFGAASRRTWPATAPSDVALHISSLPRRISGKRHAREGSDGDSEGAASARPSQKRLVGSVPGDGRAEAEEERSRTSASESEDGATPTRQVPFTADVSTTRDGVLREQSETPLTARGAQNQEGEACHEASRVGPQETREVAPSPPEPVAPEPRLFVSHPIVAFLAPLELQGFARMLIVEHRLKTCEDLVEAVQSEQAAAHLLGPRASKKQAAELWRGVLRRQRDMERVAKHTEAETRRRALAEAREARAQAKKGKRGSAKRKDSPPRQQRRLEECASVPQPEGAQPVAATITAAVPPRLPGDRCEVVEVASSSEESQPLVNLEECSASQLFESLFETNDALHQRGRKALAHHMAAAKTTDDTAEKATAFMSSLTFRGREETKAPCPTSRACSPPLPSDISAGLSAVVEYGVEEAVTGHHRFHKTQISPLGDSLQKKLGGGEEEPTLTQPLLHQSTDGVAANAEDFPASRGLPCLDLSASPFRRELEEEGIHDSNAVMQEHVYGRLLGYWSTNGATVPSSCLPAPAPSRCVSLDAGNATPVLTPKLTQTLSSGQSNEPLPSPMRASFCAQSGLDCTPPLAVAHSNGMGDARAVVTTVSSRCSGPRMFCSSTTEETFSSARTFPDLSRNSPLSFRPQDASDGDGALADVREEELEKELIHAIRSHLRAYNTHAQQRNRRPGSTKRFPRYKAVLVAIPISDEDEREDVASQVVLVKETVPHHDAVRRHVRCSNINAEGTCLPKVAAPPLSHANNASPELRVSPAAGLRGNIDPHDSGSIRNCNRSEAQDKESTSASPSTASSVAAVVTASASEHRRPSGIFPSPLQASTSSCHRETDAHFTGAARELEPTQISSGDSEVSDDSDNRSVGGAGILGNEEDEALDDSDGEVSFIPSQLSAITPHTSQDITTFGLGDNAGGSFMSTRRALSFTPENEPESASAGDRGIGARVAGKEHSNARHCRDMSSPTQDDDAECEICDNEDDEDDDDEAWWESLGLGALERRTPRRSAHDPFLRTSEKKQSSSRLSTSTRVEQDGNVVAHGPMGGDNGVVEVLESDAERNTSHARTEEEEPDEDALFPQPWQASSRQRSAERHSRQSNDAHAPADMPGTPTADGDAAWRSRVRRALVHLYRRSPVCFDRLSSKRLERLCEAVGLPTDSAALCEAPIVTEQERRQVRKEAMAAALRLQAVRDLFAFGAAPAMLHRAESMSALPYRRPTAASLPDNAHLIRHDDFTTAKAAAKAMVERETKQCVLTALAADAVRHLERTAGVVVEEGRGQGETMERTPGDDSWGQPPPPPVSVWEKALLFEPMNPVEAVFAAARDFPFVSVTMVRRLLDSCDIPVAATRGPTGDSSPLSTPPLTSMPLHQVGASSPLASAAVQGSAYACPSPDADLGDRDSNSNLTVNMFDASPLSGASGDRRTPSRSRSRSPTPGTAEAVAFESAQAAVAARKRENTRRYFANQGFRTRGGLWRGRGGGRGLGH